MGDGVVCVCVCVCVPSLSLSAPFWDESGAQGGQGRRHPEDLHSGHLIPTVCYPASHPWGQLAVEVKNVLIPASPGCALSLSLSLLGSCGMLGLRFWVCMPRSSEASGPKWWENFHEEEPS